MSHSSGRSLAVLLVVVLSLGAFAAVGTAGSVDDGTACGFANLSSPANATPTASDDVRVVVRYERGQIGAACAGDAVSAVGGEVLGGDDVDLVPMTVARVDPAAIDTLASQPGIATVERDAAGRAIGFDADTELEPTQEGGSGAAQSVPWGIKRVQARAAADSVTADEMADVQVAVLDSGIDLDHPDIGENVVWGGDFLDDKERLGRQYSGDVLGHGTHVAGTIAAADNSEGVVGVAPNVELYSMRVLNEDNFGYYSWWVEGLDHAVKGPDGTIGTDDDADVISVSLGGSDPSPILKDGLEAASEHALIVVAAGNSGDGDPSTDDVSYPAQYDASLAVAATAKDDLTATFSSEGPAVDIAAPGVHIRSTERFDSYGYKSGTSMATPHVSGAAALLVAQDLADGSRDRSPSDLRESLTTTALDIHGDGLDNYSGHGLLRAADALGVSVTDDPPVASLSVSDTRPFVNDTIQVDASASSDDRGIDRYKFSVDGGPVTTLTDPLARYTPETAGNHTISLTVVDTAGQTNTTSVTVEARTDQPPTAAFEVSPTDPYVNETITLDANASTDDRGVVTYKWLIGTERVDTTTPTVSFTLDEPGSYNVSLTVVDKKGQTDTTNGSVTVAKPIDIELTDVRSPAYPDKLSRALTTVTVADRLAADGTIVELSSRRNGTVVNSSALTVSATTTDAFLDVPTGTVGNYTVSVTATVSVSGQQYTAVSDSLPLRVVETGTSVPPSLPVVGDNSPTNLDSDSQLEDIDGDGEGTVFDAIAYFNNRRNPVLTGTPSRFDFNGNGVSGEIADVVALYDELRP